MNILTAVCIRLLLMNCILIQISHFTLLKGAMFQFFISYNVNQEFLHQQLF